MTTEEFRSADLGVRNARRRILDILENESRDKEGNGARWERVANLFEVANLVTVSTWYLKLGGRWQCEVCRREGNLRMAASGGLCDRHRDWQVVVLHDRVPWTETVKMALT